MLGWITYKAVSYALIPACTWISATVCSHIGVKVANRVWSTAVNKLRGTSNITVKLSQIYIVYMGNIIEIDPGKKYTISRGEVIVEDLCKPDTATPLIAHNDCASNWTVI